MKIYLDETRNLFHMIGEDQIDWIIPKGTYLLAQQNINGNMYIIFTPIIKDTDPLKIDRINFKITDLENESGVFYTDVDDFLDEFGDFFNECVNATADTIVNTNTDEIELLVNLRGHECSANTTTTPLSANEEFLGSDWQDTLDYGTLSVSVCADVASATDGFVVQWSSDKSIVNNIDEFNISANVCKTFTFGCSERYYKIKYTNGSIAQTEFSLTSLLKRVYIKPSSHRITDNIIGEDDAELVKSVLTGIKPNGTFSNTNLTSKSNLKVSLDEYGDTPAIDAFDRLRTSSPFTIFDSKQLHDKQPLFWDEVIGGVATSTHNPVNADVEMRVTASASDYVIRQTKQRFNYQPGKSALVFMTYYSPKINGQTVRIGLFDGTTTNSLTPNNGIFFETNGTLSWNIAKNGSIPEIASQANWNVDTLDGSGDENNASGLMLDTDATQILIIDFEWLGVGRVRVGFVIDGIIRYVHYFNHANNSTFDSVYMSSPNLPLRYTIETDGSNSGELDHICSTIISEGGQQQTGVLRVVDTGFTHIDASVADTTYAVLGIKLKDAYKDVTVIPEFLSMINEANDDFRWSVSINPTIAGTFTYSDLINSAVQGAQGTIANTVSDEGIIVASGYASIDTQQTDQTLNTALRIGMSIEGVSDELVLCVTPLSTGADIQASINFRELL